MLVLLARALFAGLCYGIFHVDRSLRREQADAQIIAARRYDTCWNTGEEALAGAALAPSFVGNTLSTGRPRIAGPLQPRGLCALRSPTSAATNPQMRILAL